MNSTRGKSFGSRSFCLSETLRLSTGPMVRMSPSVLDGEARVGSDSLVRGSRRDEGPETETGVGNLLDRPKVLKSEIQGPKGVWDQT